MLRIGDFSKLAQVSVKTLRHYGRLGLFQPAWIDRFTGYRYYTLDQLPHLDRILALKDLGFSLVQVRELLRADLEISDLWGMFKLRRAELEQHIHKEQAQLDRVEARLQQLESEGALSAFEVVIRKAPSLRIAGIRDYLSDYQAIIPLFEELQQYLRRRHHPGVTSSRPPLVIFYDTEYSDQGMEAEVAVPVSGPLPASRRVASHGLPGAEMMACLVYRGAYEGLAIANSALLDWVDRNGYQVAGPNRGVFLQGSILGMESAIDLEPADHITEVQVPVAPKRYLRLAKQEEGEMMEPRIVAKPAFQVVGLCYHGKNENNEIAQMWSKFVPRIGEIKHIAHGSYGVCQPAEEDGCFQYLACMAVHRVEEIPEGMICWDVPEQTYAVFDCTLPTIGETYQYAFQTWIPSSDYRSVKGPDFEYYDESFDPDQEGSILHIYVPITR